MSDYTNDHINANQEQTHGSSAPISGSTERSAAARRAVARPVGASGGSAGGGSAAGTWKTKKSKPKKEKMHWSCIKEVPKKDSKALTMTLKKMKIEGFADWKRGRPVAGKSGYAKVKISFQPAIDDATLRKYVGAVDDLIRFWNVVKHEIPNVQHNRVALGRALKEFGGDIQYRWAGFANKEKTLSKVIFQHDDGEAVSNEEGTALMVLFRKHFGPAEEEAKLWAQYESAGRTITIQNPKKFSGIVHKLEQEIKNNRASEGIEMIPAKLRCCLEVAEKRFVTDVNGKKNSQMRLDFKAGSDTAKLTDPEYHSILYDLTQHWAQRCATWERVYAGKDARKQVEVHANEVIARWLMFLKNKWMLTVLANVKKIISSTSSKEEAGKVFLAGVEAQVLKDAERKARMRDIFKPKVERKVEVCADAGMKTVERESSEKIWGGGAAARKKTKSRKEQKTKGGKIALDYLFQELRIDPADGKAYPRKSFIEVYGEFGQNRWEKAMKTTGSSEPEPEQEPEPEPELVAVETPPEVVIDASLKSNSFAALMTPRDFTA
jgi:hypothetical protein